MNFRQKISTVKVFPFTPIINVLFLGWLFFVVAHNITREEKLLGLDLPSATTASAANRHHRQLTLNLDNNGEIFIGNKKFTLASVERRLTQLSALATTPPMIIIRADALCQHRHVVNLIDLCNRAGIKQINISTFANE